MSQAASDPPNNSRLITWGPVAAIVVTIFIYFASQVLASLLLGIYAGVRGWSSTQIHNWLETSTTGQFALILLFEGLTLGLLAGFLRWRRASFKNLGLQRWLRPKDLGYALGGFAVYFPLLLVAQKVVGELTNISQDQKQQIGFNNVNGPLELTLVFVSLVILPPVTEEILTRGFLYTGLKTRLPKYVAVIITSALFAIVHLQFGSGAPLLWTAAIDTFLLSVILIYLRNRSGSLWASILLHMLKNGLAFLALFILKF